MARRTKEVNTTRPPRRRKASKPAGVPPQDPTVDVWVIVADPEVCASEVAAGQHDRALVMIAHVARSQNIDEIAAACDARRCALEGRK